MSVSASSSVEQGFSLASDSSHAPRRDRARTQTAAILTPRLRHVLKHLQQNPHDAIAAQDFGHLRYLTKSLDGCDSLPELRDQTRELALSILDIRCDELQRLIESNPLHELSPCDVGVIKERNRILDVIGREFKALERKVRAAQKELERQAQEQADIEAYCLSDEDEAPLSPAARRGEAAIQRGLMRDAVRYQATDQAADQAAAGRARLQPCEVAAGL